MGEPWKYRSSWKTEDLLKNYYTQDEIDTLLSAYSTIFKVPISAAAPASPVEGQEYINSVDNKLYIYYGSQWQELHSLTPAVPPVIESGVPMGLLLALTYQT